MSSATSGCSTNLRNFPSDIFLGTLIASFPTEWQGFFGALNASASNCVQNASSWLEEKLNSRKNPADIPPNFTVLFEHLTRDFPVVFENNLRFKPKILLLPLNLQRNLFSFIFSKSTLIPLDSLKVMDTKLDFLRKSDGWFSTMRKLLKVKIKEFEQIKGRSLLKQGEEKFYVDIITTQSSERFKGLCQEINRTTSITSNDRGISSKPQWKSIEDEALGHLKEYKEGSCPDVIQCTETSTSISQQEGKWDENMKTEEVMEIDYEEIFTKGPLNQNIAEDQVNTTCSPFKMIKPGDQLVEKSFQLCVPPVPLKFEVANEQPALTDDLKVKLAPLLSLIQALESCEGKAATCIKALQIFCELSSLEIEKASDVLKLENLSEQALVLLCQNFVLLEAEPSYMHACAFASYCILPQLQKLEQMASRLLTTTVISFSKKYPKAACDGIFIKLLSVSSFKSFQADIVSKTLKDMPNQDNLRYLLQFLLQGQYSTENKCQWNEDKISVLQSIIDCKIVLDDDLFKDYVGALQANSVSMVKSLKFAKLLLATINSYGPQIILHKDTIESILQGNQTFLKKAGLAALKKGLSKVKS